MSLANPKSSRGLGRGLAALIPDSALAAGSRAPERARVRMVPLDEICPNPEQPRQVFAPEDLESLAESLREHGFLSPLLVRPSEGRYVLIAGERRLRAAGLAGLAEVPVLVRDVDNPADQLELALVENLQRADLDAVETARALARLVDEFGYTQAQVAERVGKKRATVANLLRLLKLPEFVLDAVRGGRLSAGHARALLPVTDPQELRKLVAMVIARHWSVRRTEREVAALTRTPAPVRTTARDRRDRAYAYATQLLTDALHTSVQIRPLQRGGGRIVIDYSDAEDLERLIAHLRVGPT